MHDATRGSTYALLTRALGWLAVLCVLALCVPGCGGCQADDPATAAKKKKDKEAAEKKKKSEKPKEPFEDGRLIVEPGEGKITSNLVKPGHWVTASRAFKSNDGDVVGELHSAAVDLNGRPLEAEHTPFRMVMTRSAPLPKGQTKHFEFLYYVPRRYENQNATVRLQSTLFARGGGRELFRPTDEPMTRMPASQYHLLVLASDPDKYGYIKRLESINPISDELNDNAPTSYYRVSLPKLDKRVPLPRHPLAWSAIAYIFWDNVDPELLTPEQQDGLIDWLHWGGQLIVIGPDSLDALRASFLGPYLPAEKVRSREYDQAALAELNKFWSLADKKKIVRTLDVVEGKPLVGIEMKLRDDAQYVDHTSDLVAERRVGRGRIAVTAISLTTRPVVNWASLDNFFNGAILRRPARKFEVVGEFLFPEVQWVAYEGRRNDPRLVSTLRYFSRDIGFQTGSAATTTPVVDQRLNNDLDAEAQAPTSVVHPDVNDWHFDGYGYDQRSGVAGWNDFCAAADAARESLREAAGISIPRAGFVLQVVAIYLLVLVPLNWGFFKLLGRVELAWVAAPIIAIVGAVAVVRVAQLDIGFARSQSEIAILELHNGHTRGHVTRYTALYSSLTTPYNVRFEDGAALAQPFPTRPRQPTSEFNRVTPTTCYLHRDQGLSLTGFIVRSNTTDFVHTEQILPLGGALKLVGNADKGQAVENQTKFVIRDAAVLHCVKPGEYMVAELGTLDPQMLRQVQWQPLPKGELHAPSWADSPVMSRPADGSTEVSLYRLVNLATQQLRLDPGDFRLIGWMDDHLPGMEVAPRASQVTARTLVLAHLQEAPLPAITSDKNMRISVVDEEEEKSPDDAPESPPEAGF